MLPDSNPMPLLQHHYEQTFHFLFDSYPISEQGTPQVTDDDEEEQKEEFLHPS